MGRIDFFRIIDHKIRMPPIDFTAIEMEPASKFSRRCPIRTDRRIAVSIIPIAAEIIHFRGILPVFAPVVKVQQQDKAIALA